MNKFRGEFRNIWPDGDYTCIDGVRVDTPDHMAIIRASQNGPYITIKFEAKNKEKYQEIKNTLKQMLQKYPEVEWDKGVNTHALN
jgi:phosphomannomutase